ncbi:MAG: serine hydrolase domain-containing protein [Pirellulales bacterium]
MTTNSRRIIQTLIVLSIGVLLSRAVYADDAKDRFDWTLHNPEEVGMSADGLNKVREVIQKNIDRKVVPGAVTAIVRHNKLVWFEAQGMRDAPTGTKMGKDDIFRMMSGTKPVVAVAVLILMQIKASSPWTTQ